MEVCDTFLFQLSTSLESICSKSNFSAGIHRFKIKLAKSRLDDIVYVCVNNIFYSMTFTLISTSVRFPSKILLHCVKNIYLLLLLFIKSCLPGTQGRILIFYFNYKPLFLLPNNTFYPITLFYIALGSIILLLYCI